jgi:hypothetical protein
LIPHIPLMNGRPPYTKYPPQVSFYLLIIFEDLEKDQEKPLLHVVYEWHDYNFFQEIFLEVFL